MKRLPEKLIIAAIILSCGFVMQSDPPQPSHQSKGPDSPEVKRLKEQSDVSSADVKAADSPDGTSSAGR